MAMRNITHYENEWIVPIILGSILLLAGILMIVYKREALQIILMAAGVLILAFCIVNAILAIRNGKDIPILLTILLLAIGLLLLLVPGLVTDALMIILSVVLAIYGIFMIFGALGSDGRSGNARIVALVIGVISLALGVYAILNLDNTADIVMIIIGAVLAFIGAMEIVRGLRTYNTYA